MVKKISVSGIHVTDERLLITITNWIARENSTQCVSTIIEVTVSVATCKVFTRESQPEKMPHGFLHLAVPRLIINCGELRVELRSISNFATRKILNNNEGESQCEKF